MYPRKISPVPAIVSKRAFWIFPVKNLVSRFQPRDTIYDSPRWSRDFHVDHDSTKKEAFPPVSKVFSRRDRDVLRNNNTGRARKRTETGKTTEKWRESRTSLVSLSRKPSSSSRLRGDGLAAAFLPRFRAHVSRPHFPAGTTASPPCLRSRDVSFRVDAP